jgi:hypothetical protein
MALRLHRVTDEQWQRQAASRRDPDVIDAPPRASISAIQVELKSLDSRTD